MGFGSQPRHGVATGRRALAFSRGFIPQDWAGEKTVWTWGESEPAKDVTKEGHSGRPGPLFPREPGLLKGHL